MPDAMYVAQKPMLFSGRRYQAGEVVEGAATDRALPFLLSTGMLAATANLSAIPTEALVAELERRGLSAGEGRTPVALDATERPQDPPTAPQDEPEPEPQPPTLPAVQESAPESLTPPRRRGRPPKNRPALA